jgi:hypothetical protein
MISSSSLEVVNIDGHWRFIWSLTSGSVKINRSIYKLA